MSIGAIPTAMIPPSATGVPGHTAGMPSTAPILPPNHTIYINNLNEKIKTDELKKSLYAVFVQFGQILDIITGKSVKMRGQAFVVFSEISSARSALEAMRGFPLYEKPMCINFARTTSDIIAKREGTYVERPKRQPPPPPLPPPSQQQNTTIDAAALIGGGSARAIRRRQQRLAAAQAAALAAENGGSTTGGSSTSPQPSSTAVSQSHPPPINPATIPDQPPNKILFLTNLPEDANEAMLGMLFAPFVGFREIRMVMDIRPNHTLYVNNLNDKLKKADLKRALYYLFSPYGRVLEIIAMKTPKMRGQAFIIFQAITSATTALRVLQGFQLFDKPMRIQYARKNSTQIEVLQGVNAETQKKKEEEREKRRRRKLAQRQAAAAAAAAAAGGAGAVVNGQAGDASSTSYLVVREFAFQVDGEVDTEPPNRVLFVSNLPEETTDAMLTMLFNQFSGFKEARRAVGGIGFVEYETEAQATAAKVTYHGFKLTRTHAISVTYAKH
ncbi:unnamed protein product [Hydatigera taeniaeformis]|uniref:U2 small nuclear ribonucleoprotein B n=1 Tax=Hydatigena taeniaeformis TaxID=6205 RepID=A0A0R3WR52_HYDTA|nr:unnamed protein product [Hydatigera taeniaeformis]